MNSRQGYRDLFQDIERSLERGGSPHSLEEVIRWFTAGLLHVMVGNYMSFSFRLNAKDGMFTCQVVHLAGQWDDREAGWMLKAMKDQMRIWCVSETQFEGRPGWARFLKMKGIEL